ncbi:MAG TPA: trypsin-like peptidase domain-containing protein, partial [Oscillospiraceae bacterium]|nr:trypsin-like peptidase domain-containing protein [Oscillospiraceae bacterium]
MPGSLFAQTMDVNNLRTSYQAFIGNVTPGSDVSAKGKRAEIRRIGASIPGKDIAILKMDATNLPTVTLGDDTDIRTGDQVYAMGYPASATLSDALNIMQAIQEPTLTQGIISARKEMMNGWTIFQTDVDIHGGNSGGPLFNSAGEVIGVNTFGMIDDAGFVAGMNFAIPISVAKEFLNEINVTPTESKFTSDFKRAHAMVESGDYLGAVELLRSINDVNPGFPVVQELLASARQLADANPTTAGQKDDERETTAPLVTEPGKDENKILGMKPTTFYIALAAVIIVIALLVVLILVRKKRSSAKKAQAQGHAPQYYPPQQPYQAPPMQQQMPPQQAPPMQGQA